MNILFVLPYFLKGGFENSIIRLAGILSSSDNRVSIAETASKEYLDKSFCEKYKIRQIALFDDSASTKRASILEFLKSYKTLDAIFCFSDPIFNSVLPLISSNIYIIQMMRNDHTQVYASSLINARFSSAFVTNNPKQYNTLLRIGTPPHKTYFIPNSSLKIASTPTDDIVRELQKKLHRDGQSEIIRLLYVGRVIHESKRVFDVAHLAKSLIDRGLRLSLIFVGDGSDLPKLKELTQKLGISEICLFLDWQDPESLSYIYKWGDYLILSSKYEGMPNVVIEAMSYGCIPIVRDMDQLSDFLTQEGISGITYRSTDDESLYHSILYLNTHPNVRASLLARMKKYYEHNFTIDVESKNYLYLLDRLRNPNTYGHAKSYHLNETCGLISSELYGRLSQITIELRLIFSTYIKQPLAKIVNSTRKPFTRTLFFAKKELIPNNIIPYIPSWRIRRWYYTRFHNLEIQQRSRINLRAYIYFSNNKILIGQGTMIDRECVLDGRGGLNIGNNVNISPGCAIYSSGHDINSSTYSNTYKEINIEDYVSLGSRSMIMPGCSLRYGTVVLPGSVVTKTFPPYSIIGGVPARIISNRTKQLNYTLQVNIPFV